MYAFLILILVYVKYLNDDQLLVSQIQNSKIVTQIQKTTYSNPLTFGFGFMLRNKTV